MQTEQKKGTVNTISKTKSKKSVKNLEAFEYDEEYYLLICNMSNQSVKIGSYVINQIMDP